MKKSFDLSKERILFFAHRKNIDIYFGHIIDHLPLSGVLSREQYCYLSIFRNFKLPEKKKLNHALKFEWQTLRASHKKESVIKHFFKLLKAFFRFVFLYAYYYEILSKSNVQTVVVWGGYRITQASFLLAAKNLGLTTVFLENGFLPNTTQVDSHGVNIKGSLSKEADFYLSCHFEQGISSLPQTLVKRESKRERSNTVQERDLLPERYVFIPFQVNDDTQILINSPRIKSMEQFFDEICSIANAFQDNNVTFVIKEHPSCNHDYAKLHDKLNQIKINIVFINDESTEELIKHSLAVITINSSVGMESLLFKKPVICLGEAVYCIDGLALSSRTTDEVIKSLKSVFHGWLPDEKLRIQFLLYLYHVHLVKGNERHPSEKHYIDMAERISKIHNNFEQAFTD